MENRGKSETVKNVPKGVPLRIKKEILQIDSISQDMI